MTSDVFMTINDEAATEPEIQEVGRAVGLVVERLRGGERQVVLHVLGVRPSLEVGPIHGIVHPHTLQVPTAPGV